MATTHAGGDVSFHFSESVDDCDEDGGEGELTALALIMGGIAATSPWWAPPVVLEDRYELAGRFPKYPYKNGHNGFQVLDDDQGGQRLRTGSFFVRGMVDYGDDFQGTQRLGANLHLETRRRWGFDAEWARYMVSAGNPTGVDHQFGDGNVIVRFAQSKHAQWWTGAGFNWFEQRGDTDYGYNFTYGADIYLGEPWIGSAQFDLGEIERQGFFRARVQIGVLWHGIEAFTGFDYLDYRAHHDGVLSFGLRGWF